MQLTKEQLDKLRHMLGINTPYDAKPKPYRDYYCANRGDTEMIALVEIGAVLRYSNHDGHDWYCCTEAGRVAALKSHKDIRKSKAARRYSRWLELNDALPDVTFSRFLTAPEFAEARNDV